ncbi:MAG: DUF72 domain-containing protein [Planctomycetia bacterium]|nr:DUF72 domain-containing protein [Planctomycetia bacterium]
MRFFVGTSGYSYKEWKGSFYPEKLPQNQMLSYYGQRFSTVEINNTFYRMPKASVLESWAGQVPEGFRFVLKASQRITHHRRLKDAVDETDYLLRTARVLERRLGPLLFQLPPDFKKDLPRLEAFLGLIDVETQAAFEFRHESWFDDEVFDCLRKNSCALCIGDVDDTPSSDLVKTAGFGYVRLRREAYNDQDLGEWIKRLRSEGWDEAYVFFKHEDAGAGPKLAARFLELAGV